MAKKKNKSAKPHNAPQKTKAEGLPKGDQEPLLPRRAWGLVFFLPLILFLFWPNLKPMFQDPQVMDWVLIERVREIGLTDDTANLTLDGDWEKQDIGLNPIEGEDERPAILAQAPGGPWDSATVRVVGAPDSIWTIRLTRKTDYPKPRIESRTIRDIPNETLLKIGEDDIPLLGDPFSPVEFELRLQERGNSNYPAIRNIELRLSAAGRSPLPWLPDLIALGVLPLLAAIMCRAYFGFSAKRSLMAGAAVGIIFSSMIVLRPPDVAGGSAWAAATGIAAAAALSALLASHGWMSARVKRVPFTREQWARISTFLFLGFVLLAGLQPRWEAFEIGRRTLLSPDGLGFVEMAARGGALYDTWQTHAPWVREPFFPWLLRIWYLFTPDTAASARLGSMFLSFGAVAAVFLVGHKLLGLWPALVGALTLALMPEWAEMASRVLRLDLTVLLLMGLIAARIWMDEKPTFRAVLWGLLGAALVLNRISAISLIIPLLIWEVLRKKWKAHEIILAVGLLIVPVIPHLIFNARQSETGDFMYSSTVHTRFYMNEEFKGQPGYPTVKEVLENPYVGEPTSTGTYFLKHHSIPELALRHAQGYWLLFVWKYPRWYLFRGIELLMLPGLIGAYVILRRRELWWAPIWWALMAFPYAFIATVGADWRLGGEVFIWVAWTWALGVGWLINLVWVKAKKRFPMLESAPVNNPSVSN